MSETAYVVLRQLPPDVTNRGANVWIVEHSHVLASSAEAAIRIASKPDDDVVDVSGPTRYVAVPARSWKPVTVRTETHTVVRIEEDA